MSSCKLVEKGGMEVLLPQYLWSVHKQRIFISYPDDQLNQYMFILRISIFEMPAMLSCTSNTMLDRNRPYSGGGRWFGILVMQQPTRTEILHILMTNLINICSFWEYRYSKWRHWSRVNRILCWIKIGLILVEKDGLEFLMPQLWWSVHKHPKFYTSSCL